MPKPELEFLNTAAAPVQHVGEEEHTILAKDPKTGDATMIVQLPKGYAQDDSPRIHDFWEEVILLDGRLYDRSLDQWFGPGYYACRPPGMVHGPYDACPERGARQFINIRYDPGYEPSTAPALPAIASLGAKADAADATHAVSANGTVVAGDKGEDEAEGAGLTRRSFSNTSSSTSLPSSVSDSITTPTTPEELDAAPVLQQSKDKMAIEIQQPTALATPVPQWPWRRLIRFVTEDGREVLGEPVDGNIDRVRLQAEILDAKSPWDLDARRSGEIAVVKQLLSPLTAEQVGTIRATGLNYTDHALELGLALPSVPALFFKPAAALANPGDEIPVPIMAQDDEMDYEVELAIVIGRSARNVTAKNALDYVLGWTCANDLTARKLQEQSTQWGFCKGFDKFCPLGPCIVSTTALPDPRDVSLHTYLNGEEVQSGSAKKMIWHVSEIVEYVSRGTTLQPGTVILTGTPPGIGHSRGLWLRDGDEVRCSISGGIGTLVNKVVYE
ncbi:hypothetical protein Q8F55_004310 [Vanrija albida]|uniref:Fumarylacetoacetase-like C-terminal domain-containing protein n=1 Tax=Vanrija albida TaxID=181172 RepID=A0ABR3Q6D7_9TREE